MKMARARRWSEAEVARGCRFALPLYAHVFQNTKGCGWLNTTRAKLGIAVGCNRAKTITKALRILQSARWLRIERPTITNYTGQTVGKFLKLSPCRTIHAHRVEGRKTPLYAMEKVQGDTSHSVEGHKAPLRTLLFHSVEGHKAPLNYLRSGGTAAAESQPTAQTEKALDVVNLADFMRSINNSWPPK